MTLRSLVLALALGVTLGLAPLSASVQEPRQAPLKLQGGRLSVPEKGTPAWLKRKVELGAPGVWYLWIKATNKSRESGLLRFSLDGKETLHSSRRELLVQRFAKGQWHSSSRYPGFRLEVHVDTPGVHELQLQLLEGDLDIESIALTLFHAASLDNDEILHKNPGGEKGFGLQNFSGQGPGDDPGQAKVDFEVSKLKVDGFHKDRKASEAKVLGTAYYVDAVQGDDTKDGRSPASAWRSLAWACHQAFKPGDALLLKRGSSWHESLHPRGSGSPEQPILLGAYGSGERPEVNGGSEPGLFLKDESHWIIQDLRLTSDPDHLKTALFVLATKDAKKQPRGIKIQNCVAYDSGAHGIMVGSEKERGGNGFDGVEILNCLAYANRLDGIVVNGVDQKGCRNVVIRDCSAYSNLGMAGIWIHGGQNGLIENCLAYSNACINIWTWNSINVTMRHCEAYRGRPGRDAGGFDIDFACEACTMEYCYAHHNEGIGFLLMGSGEMPYLGFPTQSRYNLMRYCVAVDNDPGIGMVETLQHSKIYNNLVLATGSRRIAFTMGGWPRGPNGWGGLWPSNIDVFNNIFLGRQGAPLLWVDDYATGQGNRFDNNLYWRADDSQGPLIRWAGRKSGPDFWKGSSAGTFPPQDYQDLASFQKATGQEPHGIQADPGLRVQDLGAYGRLPLEAARLKKGSPAFGAGKKVELDADWLAARRAYLSETGAGAYGIPMEPGPDTQDYFGKKLRLKTDIGHQGAF